MGALRTVVGLHAYVLPFAIVAAWMGLALWDLSRRQDLGRGGTVGWLAVVLLVPVVGPAIALLSSRSLARWQAAVFVGGGVLAYLVVLALSAALSGTA